MSVGLATLAVVGFIAMEGVSYATHRWVMHGFGMRWHRSHHLPPKGRLERNDAFPLLFSLIGLGMFRVAFLTATTWLFWLGSGVAAYGLCYMLVHDVYIHRRLRCPIEDRRALDWLRDSHEIHHLYGGEPYGMLLPLVSKELRSKSAGQRRSDDALTLEASRRDRIRRTRTRL
jgi:beta-carotene 3-hydroxylase